ncbi:MAG TPA: thiopeptide-type bacteriocin biosynthesis protein [Bdellovibrionales bacterium]|nr:thiopeptide-type bacteriocin biosynthesis protein [Bdellovibrionales bacterium]
MKTNTSRQIECVYYKVYMQLPEMDAYLTEVLTPLAKESIGPGRFDYFFFVRYHDRGFHLRLRFFGPRAITRGEPRARLLEELKRRSPSAPEPARYRPEVARYGGKAGVRLCERIFDASSVAALDFLRLKSQGLKMSRAEFALASGDSLLRAMGLDDEERSAVFAAAQTAGVADAGPESGTGRLVEMARNIIASPQSYWQSRDSAIQEVNSRMVRQVEPLLSSRAPLSAGVRRAIHLLGRSCLHMHYNRLGIPVPEERVLLAIAKAARSSRG